MHHEGGCALRVYRFGRFVVLKFPKLCVIELSYKDNFKIFYNFLVAYWVPTRIFPTLGKSYYLFKIQTNYLIT